MKAGLKIILITFLFGFVCAGKKVDVVTYAQLKEQGEFKNNDTLYVVNFWATWCGPCVKEMPFFEESSKVFANQKVKIVYVCLNSVKELAGVESFVKAKKIQNQVLLLNESNPNNWIDKVDSGWSGAIPATVMYKGGDKVFFKEGGFTQVELDEAIVKMNTTINNINEK
ncbi:MAG TPA: TlpA disulfide reductase family protein [Bacteroidia bacterium]|nr:TlpA disulfide reductase family protein [Bacteroidia bacterium]